MEAPIPPNADGEPWRWKICKEKWNAWALGMLALKEQLIKADRWSPDKLSKEQMLYRALANVNFSGLVFPENIDFQGFIFPMEAWFSNAQFGKWSRRNYDFHWRSDNHFIKRERFEYINFEDAYFSEDARFDFVQFNMDSANFENTQFLGNAGFNYASFNEDAEFNGVQFSKEAGFDGTRFRGKARFDSAVFLKSVFFDSAQFVFEAWFKSAKFLGTARFNCTQFNSTAVFEHSQLGPLEGLGAGFIDFSKVLFRDEVDFSRSQLNCPINFIYCHFMEAASFRSCRSTVSFALSDCFFAKVPDLIEADFHHPPMLDNIDIRDPVQRYHKPDTLKTDPRPKGFWVRFIPNLLMKVTANPDDGAKYRALRRLAIEGKDHVQELAFHPQEVRCRRFWHDKPWGLYIYEVLEQRPSNKGSEHLDHAVWRVVNKTDFINFQVGEDKNDPKNNHLVNMRRLNKRRRPAGTARFWFGLFYEVFSNFGRSFSRPLMTWFFLIICFAFFYTSQHLQNENSGERYGASFSQPLLSCPMTVVDDGPVLKWVYFCPWLERKLRGIVQPIGTFGEKLFAGRCTRDKIPSSPLAEAFSLSVKNAFVFVSSNHSAASRRSYGCLYGFTDVTNRFPVVPTLVSFVLLLQNVLSAILIFLFLLAVRNLLKLK